MATLNTPAPAAVVQSTKLLSPLNVRFRQHASITVPPGTSPITQLLTGFIIRKFVFELNFTLQTPSTGVAGVAFPTANFLGTGAFEILSNLQILINGTNPIRNLSGRQLYMLNYFLSKNPPSQEWDYVVSTANVGAYATCKAQIDMPFAWPSAMKPIDTSLDARVIPSNGLTMLTSIGQASAVNSFAGLTVSNVGVNVYAEEFYGAPNGFRPVLAVVIPQFSIPNLSGGPSVKAPLQLQAAAANMSYAAFLLNSQSTANPPVDQDSLIRFRLYSGTETPIDVDPRLWTKQLQADRGNYPLDWLYPSNSSGGLSPNNNPISQSILGMAASNTNTNLVNPRAWYLIDLCQDGYWTQALNTAGVGGLFINVDTSAASNVTVLPIQLWSQLGGKRGG